MSSGNWRPVVGRITGGVVALAFLLAGASCGGGSSGESTPGGGGNDSVTTAAKQSVINNTVQQSVLPGYANLKTGFVGLSDAAQAFCADRSSVKFGATQQAWENAMQSWQAINWIRSGAMESDSRALRIESWPAASATAVANRAEQTLASATAITEAFVSGLPVQAQGIQAIEYLLFDSRSEADFPADSTGNRRCDYLQAIGANLASIATEVDTIWRTGIAGGTNGVSLLTGSEGASADDAFNTLTNQILSILISLKDEKLGPALGFTSTGGRVSPNSAAAESTRSNTSLSHVVVNLTTMNGLFTGAGASALEALLTDVGQITVRQGASSQFNDALQKAQALSGAGHQLDSGVGNATVATELDALYASVRSLEVFFQENVIPAVGATITFNFNDGD